MGPVGAGVGAWVGPAVRRIEWEGQKVVGLKVAGEWGTPGPLNLAGSRRSGGASRQFGDLLTAKAYDKSEHTFNVLGVMLTVNTYGTRAHLQRARRPVDRQHLRHPSAPSSCSATC